MGLGGGGSSQQTTQSLPPWAAPLAAGILNLASQVYFPGGQISPARENVAAFSPDQIQSQNMTERLSGAPVTNGAQGYINWNPQGLYPQQAQGPPPTTSPPMAPLSPFGAPPGFPQQPGQLNPQQLAGMLAGLPGAPGTPAPMGGTL